MTDLLKIYVMFYEKISEKNSEIVCKNLLNNQQPVICNLSTFTSYRCPKFYKTETEKLTSNPQKLPVESCVVNDLSDNDEISSSGDTTQMYCVRVHSKHCSDVTDCY